MFINQFIAEQIEELDANRQYGTSHIYKCAGRSFSIFSADQSVTFEEIDQNVMIKYQQWMLDKGLSLNTVSTYMRTLRAVYNKAVQAGVAPDVSYHFKKVFTGVESKVKRSISKYAVGRIVTADRKTLNEKNSEACDLFSLQFYLRGMPFVDLLQLRRTDIYGDILCYHRRKTGKRITVKLEPQAKKILDRHLSASGESQYVFRLYRDAIEKKKNTYEAYQTSLRRYNNQLRTLKRKLKLEVDLTSYTPRHTWATTAYHSKQPLGLISNALGHSSINVTEHYLRPFSDGELHLLNKKVIREVLRYDRP